MNKKLFLLCSIVFMFSCTEHKDYTTMSEKNYYRLSEALIEPSKVQYLLILDSNSIDASVINISKLTNLKIFKMKIDTEYTDSVFFMLSKLEKLEEAEFSYTKDTMRFRDGSFPRLTTLHINGHRTLFIDESLCILKNIQNLYFTGCNVSFPKTNCNIPLRTLSIFNSDQKSIPTIFMPEQIENIYLNETKINQLSDSICLYKNLKMVSLIGTPIGIRERRNIKVGKGRVETRWIELCLPNCIIKVYYDGKYI